MRKKQIAKLLVALNVHILCFYREHLQNCFNVNGKKKENLLTLRQFHVLMFMKQANVQTVSEVAQWFHISKSSMSIMFAKPEKSGYLVKKEPLKNTDGRKVYFCLTEQAERAVEQSKEQMIDAIAGCFTSFTPKEQQRFYELLQELYQMLQHTGGKN